MFTFRHMKTPAWAKDQTDIYFLVLDENNNKYGYIGLQSVDLTKGVCHNLCYKTHKKFRGQGKSKYYLKEFIEWCPLEFDIFKATVRKDNIASIKMLEFCEFERMPEKTPKTVKKPNPLVVTKKESITPKQDSIIYDSFMDSTLNSFLNFKSNGIGESEPIKVEKKEPVVGFYSYRLKRFDY